MLIRRVAKRSGTVVESTVPILSMISGDAAADFDASWLRCTEPPPAGRPEASVRLVDLFSGCGAMTLGVWEACRALGLRCEPVLAMDRNEHILKVYERNFPEAHCRSLPVEELLDSDLGSPLSASEAALKEQLGRIDFLVGGPPCQGHSNLNNHTRRADPKNALFLKMARFAEIIQPAHIVIENVPEVVHDQGRVLQETRAVLARLGYKVDGMVMRASELGAPQRRRRFITVASKNISLSLKSLSSEYGRPERTFMWACQDLEDVVTSGVFDSASPASEVNKRRIDYLFDNDLYDLPDSERPDCHRLKSHKYIAVYGRLRGDIATPTITSGFGSMGQGRFVHPTRRRTITPHEAARLQFIPDFFTFEGTKRHVLQEMIGNAVPPKLIYSVALELLR